MATDRPRCEWPGDDALMRAYHDREWGVPLHDDQKWFEFIVLDGFQAGLSWKTILHKREALGRVFHGFVPEKVVGMSEKQIEAAMNNPAIVRNQSKIRATIKNAGAFLALQKKHGSFDSFIWSFTNGKTRHNSWRELSQIPATTPLSDKVSKALKVEGFSFVGPTICYALLQAAGIVNDHLVHCFRYAELRRND